MPDAVAPILAVAAVPGPAPGAAGLARAAAVVRAAVAAAPTPGRLPVPAADPVARRIRARTRRRKRSAATALRRAKTAAGAAALRAKRARKKGRRPRRMIPGPDLALVPDLVLDQESRIVPGNPAQRVASSPKATTREANRKGALAPVPAPLLNPNPEPGLNRSPNLNPVPPHPQKPAPTPGPPPAQSPTPNPAPRLALAPVLAPSSDFGLFIMSPYPSVSPGPPFTFPGPHNTIPAPCFLINSCRVPGTRAQCLLCTCFSISFDFYSTYFFIRAVSYGGVCKITGCNLSFISLNDGMVCVLAFFKSNVEAYCCLFAGWEYVVTFHLCENLEIGRAHV